MPHSIRSSSASAPCRLDWRPSRWLAERLLKQLQIEGKLHARGKTVVVYGTR